MTFVLTGGFHTVLELVYYDYIRKQIFGYFVCLFFSDMVSLYYVGNCPVTHFVDQGGPEITEIFLSLPLECWK